MCEQRVCGRLAKHHGSFDQEQAPKHLHARHVAAPVHERPHNIWTAEPTNGSCTQSTACESPSSVLRVLPASDALPEHGAKAWRAGKGCHS